MPKEIAEYPGLIKYGEKYMVKAVNKSKETTDIALSIRTSDEEIAKWDRSRIVNALVRETNVEEHLAENISLEVEDQIFSSKIKTITTSLVRELVNAKLIEQGLEKERLKHDRLGVPLYDVEQVMANPNKENANVPHGPEATNLTFAGEIKKEYALRKVFSKDVATAHLRGDVHLHDLNMPDRPYSVLAQSMIMYKIAEKINITSIKDLFDIALFVEERNGFEIRSIECKIWDGEWVHLRRVMRHKRKNKKLLRISTVNKSIIVTEDHPMIVANKKVQPASSIIKGDVLYTATGTYEITKIQDVTLLHAREEYVYDVTTASGSFYCNGIKIHNCSGQSLEFVKKFGLSLPNALSVAKPAKHASVLLAHMVKFAASLQCHYAGAIGWDAINIFFAPYLVGMSYEEIKQIAQMLIYEFAQQAVARGGQAIFADINVYWEIPKHFENTPAVGSGGKYTGNTYSKYVKESQDFAKALFDIYLEGDGSGRPFFFPKVLLHITEKFFQTPGHERFLNHVCNVASKMGNPYFVFDRGSTAKISECCRLSFKLTDSDLEEAKHPWKMRYCALQNVTINLPRIGFTAKSDKIFDKLTKLIGLAVKAHQQKLRFIRKILAIGKDGPLALLIMNKDGDPYLKLDKVSCLIGMVGLNELVKTQIGCEMHESNEAFKYGLKIIAHMKLLIDKAVEETGMHFVLEQSPAESCAHRLARLDLKYYRDKAKNVVQGVDDAVYYTNSTYLNVGADISAIDRVISEGLFHPLIEAGALCLDYNELLSLYDDHFRIAKIGDFVEQTIEKATDLITLSDGSIQVNVNSPIKTLGIDDNGGKLVKITHVMKVPIANKKMYEICTQCNKKIRVTENHLLFRLNRGQIEEIKAQMLKPGDVVLTQPEVQSKVVPKQVCVLNKLLDHAEDITTSSALPFEILYAKYLKGRSNIFVNRQQMINLSRKQTFCVDTALKYSKNWINFLTSLINDPNLIRKVFKNRIAEDLSLPSNIVGKISKCLRISIYYTKNHLYSEATFEKVKNWDIYSVKEELIKNIEYLRLFIYYLETFSFALVASVNEVENKHPFAYDITVEGHKFSNLDGIICHNTHIWLGESKPNPESLAVFVQKVFKYSKNDQIAFSPEFTCCTSCNTTSRGLLDRCPNCGSNEIEQITRITGYFSKIAGWNKGKIAELHDRKKNIFNT